MSEQTPIDTPDFEYDGSDAPFIEQWPVDIEAFVDPETGEGLVPELRISRGPDTT